MSSADKVKLTSFDDLFKTDAERTEDAKLKVQEIRLSELFPFKDHPFQVRDDEDMEKLVDSIRRYGVITPAIARPRNEGGYELVAGHRRRHASELAGKLTMPVIIRELDDYEATILMVDTNLQREVIFLSERAFALKMKLEAIKHQGKRVDSASAQVAQKLSVEQVGEDFGLKKDQVRRFIRLTELIAPILQMVDDHRISLNPAVEISYLSKEEQIILFDVIKQEESAPSIKQARRLKEFSQSGKLDDGVILAIMTEERKETEKFTIPTKKIQHYFPAEFTPSQMETVILQLLEKWQHGNE